MGCKTSHVKNSPKMGRTLSAMHQFLHSPYTSSGNWSNLDHFSKPKRKIKKNYAQKISYISPKNYTLKNSLYYRKKPDLAYYSDSLKKETLCPL